MNEQIFIKKVKDWKNFLEHVRNLNIQGYHDRYIEELNISMGVGEFDKDTKYIVLSTTKDSEICLFGCKTLKEVKEGMEENDSWEVDSIWKDGKKLKFKTQLIVEE